MNKPKRYAIVVLISGNGSNLQAIIDKRHQGLPIDILAVISNEEDAFGLERARRAKIPTHVIPHRQFPTRQEFDAALLWQIDHYQPDLIVLAGFMRRLEEKIIDHFYGRMVNIHPSLLPKYPGLHTHRRVLEAKEQQHGCSIHFVTSEVDSGPLICQAKISIREDDTEATLKHRVQQLEHRIYPEAVRWFAEDRLKLQDGKVLFDGHSLPSHGKVIKIIL